MAKPSPPLATPTRLLLQSGQKPLNPAGGKLGVADRVLNVAMPEVVLQLKPDPLCSANHPHPDLAGLTNKKSAPQGALV